MEPPSSFRPRARLLQLLGDQLIRDPRIGVFELVKNGFDADSPSVEVIFWNVEDTQNASIEVKDTGDGMDVETIKGVWLEPGADHREVQRREGIRTEKFHRLPIGEKGVGRFAAHKLGDHISLVTRKLGGDEIVVEIDWMELAKHRYLSDAPVTIETRKKPEIFKGKNSHGTRIIISRLRHQWSRGEIRKLYRSVNAISSPFDKDYGFTVDFDLCPDPGWLEGILDPKEIEAQALFSFDFTINGSTFDFTYEFHPIPALAAKKGIKARKLEVKNQLLEYFQMRLNEQGKRVKRAVKADLNAFGIGPLRGKLYGYDRDNDVLALYVDPASLTKHLDQNGGVRVYRDSIRVYNYGEPETDWLGLDERRIQIPARRIGNNLILGTVHLDLAQSKDLVEKTNREGFVENRAYLEFKDAVLSAIIRFEQERDKDKNSIRAAFDTPDVPEGNPSTTIRGPEEAIASLKQVITDKGLTKELGEHVSKVETTYIEMRDTLLGAVGSGLSLSMVFHEIERGVRDINRAISKGDAIDRIAVMSRHLVELLEGASYFVRSSPKQSHKVSDLIRHALFSMAPRFDYHRIQVTNTFEESGNDFKVKGSQRMLTASIVNLIDNSIYWLNALWGQTTGDEKAQKRIWIGTSNELDGPAIIIADNGPGYEDAPEEVTRPFFTRKSEGMGIGLYFVNMTMQAHGGRVAFPAQGEVDIPKAYTGAVTAMVFKGK